MWLLEIIRRARLFSVAVIAAANVSVAISSKHPVLPTLLLEFLVALAWFAMLSDRSPLRQSLQDAGRLWTRLRNNVRIVLLVLLLSLGIWQYWVRMLLLGLITMREIEKGFALRRVVGVTVLADHGPLDPSEQCDMLVHVPLPPTLTSVSRPSPAPDASAPASVRGSNNRKESSTAQVNDI